MKRSITIIGAILLSLICLLAAGCDSDGNGKGISGIIPGFDDREIPLSQLAEDITQSNAVQSCYSSEFTGPSAYTYQDIEIVKEQINTENKNIITYSDITIENDFFSIVLYVKTIYNYYDDGGWIMDELSIEEMKQITPIQGPDRELVSAYLEEQKIKWQYNRFEKFVDRDLGSFSVTDVKLIDESTAYANARYQTTNVTTEGYIAFIHTEQGWCLKEELPLYVIESCNADYSCAIGRFACTGDVCWDMDIEILSIKDGIVTYNLNAFTMRLWEGNSRSYPYSVFTGANRTAIFNPIDGSFEIGSYTAMTGLECPISLTYRPKTDSWSTGGYKGLDRQ